MSEITPDAEELLRAISDYVEIEDESHTIGYSFADLRAMLGGMGRDKLNRHLDALLAAGRMRIDFEWRTNRIGSQYKCPVYVPVKEGE